MIRILFDIRYELFVTTEMIRRDRAVNRMSKEAIVAR